MSVILKLGEGLVGIAVTISLAVSLPVGNQAAGLRGIATSFVASAGIIGALWIAFYPERSSITQRIMGLLMVGLCASGIVFGGWRLGWFYGLVGYALGLSIWFVLTRVTKLG